MAMKNRVTASRTLAFQRLNDQLLVLRLQHARIKSVSIYKYDPEAHYVVVSLRAVSKHRTALSAARAARKQLSSNV
jgi:hypothetical protein